MDFDSIFGLVFFIFIIVLPILLAYVKVVPSGTVIIIDRNSHFHKKKYGGYYFFNPRTDKVTTIISKMPVTETYTNVFRTHDDTFVQVRFSTTYKAEDISMVLSSLEDSRRSIYDVINCSVEMVIKTLVTKKDNYKTQVESAIFHQLESMLEPFYIDVTSFKLYSITPLSEAYGKTLEFHKHVSDGDNPFGL